MLCKAVSVGDLLCTYDRKPRVTPIEVRPNIGAAPTAPLADEPRLEIREPDAVVPAVSVEGDVMAAVAIDQDAAQAHLAHLAERDLHRPAVGVRGRMAANRAGHSANHDAERAESNYQSLGPRNARELLRIVGVEKLQEATSLRPWQGVWRWSY